jgi:hypothetical protein
MNSLPLALSLAVKNLCVLSATILLALTGLFGLSSQSHAAHMVYTINFTNNEGFTFEGDLDTSSNTLKLTHWNSLSVAGGGCKAFLNLNVDAAQGVTLVARQSGTGLVPVNGKMTSNHDVPNHPIGDMWESGFGETWFFVSEQPINRLAFEVPAGVNGTLDYPGYLVWGGDQSGMATSGDMIDRMPAISTASNGSQHLTLDRSCAGGFENTFITVVIPEPSTFAMIGLLGACGLRRRRAAA